MDQEILQNEFIPVPKIPPKKEVPLKLDQTIPWMDEILSQFHQEQEDLDSKPSLSFQGSLKKVQTHDFGEIILVEGELKIFYHTVCVNSLEPMTQDQTCQVNAAFVHEHFEKDEAYEDVTEVFVEDLVRDIYFLKATNLYLKLCFDEYLSDAVDPYPKLKPFSDH